MLHFLTYFYCAIIPDLFLFDTPPEKSPRLAIREGTEMLCFVLITKKSNSLECLSNLEPGGDKSHIER